MVSVSCNFKEPFDSVKMLKRRGFLLERQGEDIILSDNAHVDDIEFLSEIVNNTYIGYLDGNRLIITDDKPEKIWPLFAPISPGSVGVGSCIVTHSWNKMKTRFCANKIPVRWLEANIAYYIKALSACGIYTGGCCDGNHPGRKELYIEFDGPAYKELHKCIWEVLLVDRFSINWNKSFTAVDLQKERQDQYDQLFFAADYIYQNRQWLRDARMESAAWITKSIRKRMSQEEITERFMREIKANLAKYSYC